MIENHTNAETTKQGFLLAPPLKSKAPQDCFLSFIDQIQGGLYSSSKLVRNEPRKTSDSYFLVKTRATSVGSYRRNYSHRNVALFRTKAGGPKRSNIEYMNCSFLEIDGANDNTIKTQRDVQALISRNNLPEASYVIETSKGHFHIIWDYSRPLPFTSKGESYWLAQQTRLIQLFQKDGFNVDSGASLNPTQNLRNPSQLNAFNFKRKCEVVIHTSYQKTSLRRLYRALNATSIPNPAPIPASTKLRRYSRANKTFTATLFELAGTLGTCTKTAQREVSKAIANGDLQIVQRVGNNKGTKRATEYISKLYIEPNSQKGHLSISKDNSVKQASLFQDFQANGAEDGRRNKTAFVLAVGLSCESNKTATIAKIADQLREGAIRSGLGEKELMRTIKNAVKPIYSNYFSFKKMKEWNLIGDTNHFH